MRIYNRKTWSIKNWIKGQLFGFMFIAILTGLGLWILGIINLD